VKLGTSVACVGGGDPGMMYATCGEAHPVTKKVARNREQQSASLVKVIEMAPSAWEDRCRPLTIPQFGVLHRKCASSSDGSGRQTKTTLFIR
jgi:hypothetical protein